ncbi:MAG: AraC family transcriptional regulator [Muribaculaceae bacterium]|nr:AraC family transcriptional regulator [Muribaculaceae bacterium]
MNRHIKKIKGSLKIPLHRFIDFAPNGVSARLYGADRDSTSWKIIEDYPMHRDDHYTFLMLEEGCGTMDVDFQTIELHDNQLYVVAPGQLHGNIKARGSRGWVFVVAPEYLESSYRELFAQNMFRVKPYPLSPDVQNMFKNVLDLIVWQQSNASRPMAREIKWSGTELFINIVASVLMESESPSGTIDMHRKNIAYRFKDLVREHYCEHKSVQFYASKLNVSSGYLNEVLNCVTGQSTTYWILEEVILEAKRLLIITDMTIKEIGYALGYDNYSYFNRMFHKRTGMTPLQFRVMNRK